MTVNPRPWAPHLPILNFKHLQIDRSRFPASLSGAFRANILAKLGGLPQTDIMSSSPLERAGGSSRPPLPSAPIPSNMPARGRGSSQYGGSQASKSVVSQSAISVSASPDARRTSLGDERNPARYAPLPDRRASLDEGVHLRGGNGNGESAAAMLRGLLGDDDDGAPSSIASVSSPSIASAASLVLAHP
jgi:hypothetical protein